VLQLQQQLMQMSMSRGNL